MHNEINTVQIDLEFKIEAPLERVWKSLVHEITHWWRNDFYTSSKTQAFILEPEVGGRMYEDYGNENGLLWANIIVIDAPYHLEMKGHLTPQWGGPAVNFLKISLSEKSNVTMFRFSDTTFGSVSENSKKQLTEGWQMIFEDAFKTYVEGK